jgi:cell division protein ZapA
VTALSDAPTPVTIYGKTYHLRGDDPGYLHQLAREVDKRMRQVADVTGTADTLNVAILAALNLTDECLQARSGSAPAEAEQQLGRLVALIDETLADPGCRPGRA